MGSLYKPITLKMDGDSPLLTSDNYWPIAVCRQVQQPVANSCLEPSNCILVRNKILCVRMEIARRNSQSHIAISSRPDCFIADAIATPT